MDALPSGSTFFHDEPALDIKEAAILALGTISDEDGCLGPLEKHLESLVPFLVKELCES